MVFSSAPANLDPSIWQPQRPDHGGEPVNALVSPLLEPPPSVNGGGTRGGGTCKPSLMSDRARLAKLPLPEVALKCPRCESTNTKFCYFNNYNLSQPRHFCKTCRRYWTRGGALRNVPVGGGCRKNNKRSKGGTGSKSPAATNSPNIGPSRCTTNNINHTVALPPPKLPFLPSMHHLTGYGAGPAVGLTFGNITTAGNDIDMINIGSNSQWRMQQMQPQFPFVSEGLTAGMYQFESDGVSNYAAGGVTADYFGCKNVDSGGTQVDGGINMEENPQELNLSKRFMGISGNDNQLWGISNPWSNFSSSTNHVL